MDSNPTCPRCDSGDVLPIVYGLPGPELAEESMACRVALGGCCMVFPEAHDRLCQSCGHDWRDMERLLNAPPDDAEHITIDKDHDAPTYQKDRAGRRIAPVLCRATF